MSQATAPEKIPPDTTPPELPPAPTLTTRREWGDIIVGGFLLALAAWFFVTGGRIDDFSGGAIGAADFPRGIAVLLAIGVAIIVLAAVRRLVAGSADGFIEIRRYVHVAIGMVLLVAFPFLMETFGFYLAMAPWLAAFLLLAGERKPLHVVAYVGGFLLFARVVFEMILGTPLP